MPRVHHGFGRLVSSASFERAAAETAPLWERFGLDPEPLGGAFHGTYLDPCPPSVQDGSVPDGTPVELVRPLFPPIGNETPPGWLAALPDRPTVYVTLGTLHEGASLFRLLLEALADVACNVVMTTGRANDPAALEPIPANAVVEPIRRAVVRARAGVGGRRARRLGVDARDPRPRPSVPLRPARRSSRARSPRCRIHVWWLAGPETVAAS